MGKLDGKVIIVTGGGGGVAHGMTVALAKEGAALSIVELHQERGAEVAREVAKQGGRVIAIACDVSKREQVDAAVEWTLEEFGRVDVLIDNATGVSIETSNLPFMDHTEAQLDLILGVDVKGFIDNHPDPKFKKMRVGNRPVNRLGDPEKDIGQVVAFLASGESDYLTGQTFWVDGGSTIHA